MSELDTNEVHNRNQATGWRPKPFCYGTAPLDESKSEIRVLELFPSPDRSAALTGRIIVTALPATCVEPGGHTQHHVSTTRSLPYTALSYAWGKDPTTTAHSILLVASEAEQSAPSVVDVQSRLGVTRSLHVALVHLRDEREEVVLWIDQVCINQADGDEKGSQVKMMGRIYSSAKQVLVWLGAAEEGSDEVMEAWQKVGQQARELGIEAYYTLEKWHELARMVFNPKPEDALDQKYQEMLRGAIDVFVPLIQNGSMWKWFCRPWFGRAWVVQEFCLCEHTVLVCGKKRVDPKLVFLALQVRGFGLGRFGTQTYIQRGVSMEQLSELSWEPMSSLVTCRKRRQDFDKLKNEPRATGDQLHALLKKLYVEHSLEATEHRDRIYSLLALAVDTKGENALDITPDYADMRDDKKTARILTDVARQMITNATSGRIDILCCAQFPKSPGRDGGRLADYLPSWVPDWRSNLQRSYYKTNETTDAHVFAACGDYLRVQPVPSADPRVLGLRGFVVDVIEAVSHSEPLAFTGDLDAAVIIEYLSWIDTFVDMALAKDTSALETRPAYPSRERRSQARWRVPIADLYTSPTYWSSGSHTNRAPPEAEGYHRQAVEALEFILACSPLSREEQNMKFAEFKWQERYRNQELGADYRESLGHATAKRPFLTRKGYVGIASGETKAGDVVVVFCGGRIPFVLRSLPGQMEDQFAFIGEAYCDGIMDGEYAEEGALQDLFLV